MTKETMPKEELDKVLSTIFAYIVELHVNQFKLEEKIVLIGEKSGVSISDEEETLIIQNAKEMMIKKFPFMTGDNFNVEFL